VPKAYSMDLRDRVLGSYDEGMPTKDVATRNRVSRSWSRRLKQRRAEGKPAAPARPPGRAPKLDAAKRASLAAFVAERPDATLEELRARVAAELGVTVSIGCLWNTLRDLRLPLKKSR